VDGLDVQETDWLRLDDDLRLARWRTDRLLALEYEPPEAARLGVSSVDIHELERLIGLGCPPETAVRIAA
jgi:hypothetical protein